jgi:hypothetical protein
MLTLAGGLCCVVFINPVGILALQVGGVSHEKVKFGREFCGTSTQE